MRQLPYIIDNIILSSKKFDYRQIESSVVEDAIFVIKKLHFCDSKSLFYYLSALNLLNAAIKHKLFNSLHYAFIKVSARIAAEQIIDNIESYTDTFLYYNYKEKCLFFQVVDVIFSYHQVEETPIIIQASQFEPIEWKGIRLQQIAQPLFMYAKKEYESHTSDTLSF